MSTSINANKPVHIIVSDNTSFHKNNLDLEENEVN